MPANIENRNGVLYFRAVINGTLHRKSTGFRADGGRRALELAKRRASEMETEIRAGNAGFVKKPVPTFDAWALTFLAAYYPDKYTEALCLRRPMARWKTTPLDALTGTDVELFFRERQAAGAKGGTLERERVLLKRLFHVAVKDGVLVQNPMEELRAFKTKARTRVMTRDEETRLRAILKPEWQRFLTVALNTGLRLGELLGVRPCDLREDGTWLRVRPECNKTRTERLVPLRTEAREALAAQGAADDESPYWPTHVGTPKMMMKRACVRLNIRPLISVHDLRRTFGTRCAEAGMYPRKLQKILGHANIETTMKYYVHEERKSLADALNEVTL